MSIVEEHYSVLGQQRIGGCQSTTVEPAQQSPTKLRSMGYIHLVYQCKHVESSLLIAFKLRSGHVLQHLLEYGVTERVAGANWLSRKLRAAPLV